MQYLYDAVLLIGLLSIGYSENSICVRQDGLKYEGGYDNNDAQRLCKEYCLTKNTQYYGLRRNVDGTGTISACFCSDEVPDVCPGPCTYVCGGAACGGACADCTPEYCVSLYMVVTFQSEYPKCAPSINSWSSIGGFPQEIVIDKCQESCRQEPEKGTFITVRRYNGVSTNAGCFCGDDRPDVGVGGCTYTCGGEECGGGTVGDTKRYSVYPACLEGTYGQKCEHSCLGNCLEYVCDVEDGSCPYGCNQGFHGNFCNLNCSDTCLDKKCDQSTAKCDGCIIGYYGDSCTQTCPNCISGCIQETGVCNPGGCQVGFHGESCDKNCSRTCLNDKCAQATGKCDGCVTGHYGDNCTQTCPNCISGCIQDTGVCNPGGCQIGFHGESCDKRCSTTCLDNKCAQATGKCEGCIKGYHGDECEETCLNCLNDCVQDGGICNGPCKDGYFSSTCEMSCSSNCFGGKCDQITAKCDSCEKEYFGDNCTESCFSCLDGCNQTDGMCIGGCKTGWYTPTCNTNCPQNCDGKCDLDVGHCTDGCSNGAFYGPWCSSDCSSSCNERKCDRESGICLACVPGFYNHSCTDSCPGNCKDNQCHRYNGTCPYGCMKRWTGEYCTEKVQRTITPGAIAGICVAVVCVIAGIIIAVIFIKRKRQANDERPKTVGNINMVEVRDELDDDHTTDTEYSLPLEVRKDADVYEQLTESQMSAYEFPEKSRHTKQAFEDDYTALQRDVPSIPSTTLSDGQSLNQNTDYENTLKETTSLKDHFRVSRVKGFNDGDKFIIFEGLNEKDFDEFWNILWQEKVKTIAMICNIDKSMVYWPILLGSVTHGDITVTTLKDHDFPTHSVRTFTVTKSNQTRHVCQLNFTAWPDSGDPTDMIAFLNFRRKVTHGMGKDAPLGIYSSIDNDNTGTFIAMDYLVKQAKVEMNIDVFDCVSKLRKQNKHFIQNTEQYQFLHEAVALYQSLGNTTFEMRDKNKVKAMMNITDHQIIKEYKILLEFGLKMTRHDKENSLSLENRHKNRDEMIIPSLTSCVFLKSRVPNHNAYINAVQVNSFLSKGAYLVTQIPLAETIIDFWRMVIDHNSDCAIILYTKQQAKSVPYFMPAKNKPMDVLGYEISLTSSISKELYTVSDAFLSGKSREHEPYENMKDCNTRLVERTIHVYNILLDNKEDILDPKVALDVFLDVQEWRKGARYQPITVTCLNGATYSGQFVASCNLFEMINTDNEVDVFQVVKYIRDSRPQFIGSLEQYKSLYKGASLLMNQQTYATE